MQVAILAGGRGVRLNPLTQTVPKPMVPIKGRPFLDYQIELLRDQGFRRFLLLVGYLAEAIVSHFGDGREWGVSIEYSREQTPLGTGGALKLAEPLLEDKWLLLNGDTYLPIDYGAMTRRSADLSCTILMAVYGNLERVAPNNVLLSEDLVSRYDKRNPTEMSHVDAGAYVFNKNALDRIPSGVDVSIETDLLPDLARSKKMGAYPVDQRFYDIGTFERLAIAGKVLGHDPR